MTHDQWIMNRAELLLDNELFMRTIISLFYDDNNPDATTTVFIPIEYMEPDEVDMLRPYSRNNSAEYTDITSLRIKFKRRQ